MPRRPIKNTPETLRKELIALLTDFESKLQLSDLRDKVLALIPAFHKLRDLGSSLMLRKSASAARDRILAYFLKYPFTIIHSDELMIITGIQDYPRRLRELRREMGWNIASGVTINEMNGEESLSLGIDLTHIRPEEYILLDKQQDRDAAHRWYLANEIRKRKIGSKEKILAFFQVNVGKPITGEELRYVAGGASEWARRVRELRTEEGWSITTKTTGRPDLAIGVYVLEQDRQTPPHDRKIPDSVRCTVLIRDKYRCQNCGWSHEQWNLSDPRYLELHHIEAHAEGGENTTDNLKTLCNICHDNEHRKE
ncbi:MAG: HNH endonuclease [Planctomycetaceae bacterium]|jgi:hypothetical protein|nr:HNH endonuclease [Planctomycetaceae bacterium]